MTKAQLIAAYQKPACDGATMGEALEVLKSMRNEPGYPSARRMYRFFANKIRTKNGRKPK